MVSDSSGVEIINAVEHTVLVVINNQLAELSQISLSNMAQRTYVSSFFRAKPKVCSKLKLPTREHI